MNDQFVWLFVFVGGYVLLLAFCEYLNRRRNIASEYTRKFAHIVSTLSVLLFPHIFVDESYVLAICAIFFVMLLVANRMRVLHSIDGVGRRTGGSYLLALSVGISYYISIRLENNLLYTLPILILAVCDPVANMVGRRVESRRILNRKTIAGSLAFLLSSLLISLFCMAATHHESMYVLSFIVSFTATFIELLSPRGTDNLTIPLVVICVLIL
jgi:dolichol kinase